MHVSLGNMTLVVGLLYTGLISTWFNLVVLIHSHTFPLGFGTNRKLLNHSGILSTPRVTITGCLCSLSKSKFIWFCCCYMYATHLRDSWYGLSCLWPAMNMLLSNNQCLQKHLLIHCVMTVLLKCLSFTCASFSGLAISILTGIYLLLLTTRLQFEFCLCRTYFWNSNIDFLCVFWALLCCILHLGYLVSQCLTFITMLSHLLILQRICITYLYFLHYHYTTYCWMGNACFVYVHNMTLSSLCVTDFPLWLLEIIF